MKLRFQYCLRRDKDMNLIKQIFVTDENNSDLFLDYQFNCDDYIVGMLCKYLNEKVAKNFDDFHDSFEELNEEIQQYIACFFDEFNE